MHPPAGPRATERVHERRGESLSGETRRCRNGSMFSRTLYVNAIRNRAATYPAARETELPHILPARKTTSAAGTSKSGRGCHKRRVNNAKEAVMAATNSTSRRGFASMDGLRQREIASKGGRSVPADKRSFSQDRELASEAGRKGGQASGGTRNAQR